MFWLAVGAFWVAGFANPICNGPLMAVVQATVAPEMQGRVFTLIGSFASAMSPLGLLIAGPLADKVGVSSWFLVGGVSCILMALGSLFIPAVLHFEDGRIPPQSAEGELSVPVTTLGDV
jgi:DHA3 family macrolide efflux protein-like MFS transporter